MENKTTVRKPSWFRRGVFRRHVLRKGIGRAALVSVLAIFLLVGSAVPAYADDGDDPGAGRGSGFRQRNPRGFDYGLSVAHALLQVRYGKTIDMRNAPDRTAIPDAESSFEVYEVPEGDEAGIGRNYHGATLNEDGGEVDKYDLTVYRGAFEEGSPNPVPMGRASFHPGEPPQKELMDSYRHFCEVLQNTPETKFAPTGEKGDYYLARAKFFSDLLKYGWGEMHSSDHVQTTYFRPPTEEEKSMRETEHDWNASTWPEDTIGWKTSFEHLDWTTAGSYEEGAECLWDYDFSDLNYVQQFNLMANQGVSYYLTGIHRDILWPTEENDGVYDSVTKSIFGYGDDARFLNQYVYLPSKDADFPAKEVNLPDSLPYVSNAQEGIYRYYLKESASDDARFNKNTETKILDVVVQNGDVNILLFDDAAQADEHYTNYIAYPEKMIALAPQVTFTNTFVPVTRDISVTKTWVGESADQVVVHLLADGEEEDKVVLNKDNGWKHTFKDLQKEKNGKEIQYSVQEDKLPGYTSVVEGDMDQGFEIRNTKDEPKIPEEPQTPQTRNISVSKTWVGERADQVVVHLLADGEEVNQVVLSKANGWIHIFNDLPKEKAGKMIFYTVKEEPLEGYTSVVEGDMARGFVIRNTKDEPKIPDEPQKPETRNLSVSKTWVGESADQVVVHLLADGDVVKNVVLNKANGWSYTFTDLPKENAGGEIHYTVEEEPLTGYTAVVEGDMESGFVIRNTKEEPKKPNEPKTPNPNEPKKPNPKTPKKDGKNAPRTGDMAAIGLYGLIGVGAAAGWLALQKKKRSENGR